MIDTRKAVEEIRDLPEPPQVYVVCTGAGAGLQKMLWDVPGCSKFLVGAAFPYAERDTTDFLGFTPERACNEKTAIQLAMEAYSRAWTPGCKKAIGVGMTAVVATSREHKGDHRIHIATVTEDGCVTHEIVLRKRVGTREDEGRWADLLTLTALHSAALGKQESFPLPQLIKSYEVNTNPDIREVFFERPFINAGAPKARHLIEEYAHFPGAFNPPHEGHFGIAKQVEHQFGLPVLFSIETEPPHKPALTVPEMLQRAKMLKGYNVLFTRGQALYADKVNAGARRLIIGADALLRQMTWNGSTPEVELKPMADQRVKLYVVGRQVEGRGYLTLNDLRDDGDLALPVDWPALFLSVEGRWDISSSELRSRM